jgi:2-(1,2-epoxy-1,2-dihydrophenyl)acetyl-CoA isomerase
MKYRYWLSDLACLLWPSRAVQCKTLSAKMPVYSAIYFEIEGPVAVLTLNRPDSLNAMNAEMGHDIQRAVSEIESDSRVRVLILTGAGNVFCSGCGPGGPASENPNALAEYTQAWCDAMASIRASRVPVIVAVNGPVESDGILLALCGDWLLAADSAEFVGLPSAMDSAPDFGLSWFLPRVIGHLPNLDRKTSKEPVSAQQARQCGLINECLVQHQLLPRARELATQLAQGPTRALVASRRLVDEGASNSFEAQCRRELEVNRELRECFDAKEGIQAFLEKRPARFRGE